MIADHPKRPVDAPGSRKFRRALVAVCLALAACLGPGPQPPAAPVATTPGVTCPAPVECPACAACPVCPVCPPAAATGSTPPATAAQTLQPASFSDLPGWADDDHAAALVAFQRGCRVLARRDGWREACTRAAGVPATRADARRFFESEFAVRRVVNPDATTQGLVTGYFEPVLQGSRVRSARFAHALYAPPDDLISVDLSAVVPEAAGLRLRGRLDGRKVVPYYTRAEIEQGRAPTTGRELLWTDDAVALFFLHVQGSGRVRLENGEMVRVGYADQNGHPYRSIGRWLIDQGHLRPEQASMQGIHAWARANPPRVAEMLRQNPSYVFFREVPAAEIPPELGAHGSLGVPLSPGRSIAIDPKFVTLGAPVWLDTTHPGTGQRLARLMMAQDTGSAIRGAVRADYYWGIGADAGREAGRTRQQGRMWVLLPRALAP